MTYLYLLLNIGTISVPLLRSFESQVKFYSMFKSLFMAIGLTGAFFIAWDVLFTKWGVWGFNEQYLMGIDLINLPLEEWLFFITIPYATMFSYEALKVVAPKFSDIGKYARPLTIFLIGLLSVVALLNTDKLYTCTTFTLTSIFLLLHLLWFKSTYLGRFYFTFGLILIPFFIVNGILTGSFIPDEVVWYNNAENLAIRLGTIPIEDTIYGMLLLLMNTTLFEYFQQRN